MRGKIAAHLPLDHRSYSQHIAQMSDQFWPWENRMPLRDRAM
ncbi:GntR family transcriptional regulator, partial [Sinorhizobium meliloti]